ncbi:acyl-CoA reductase [Burkholderia stagnalis]|uniref:long-chain-fatty-acyl-CoA reductase n=1 Tax=Burkholderia stagnalis TaxID=1503054 RepID=A0ABX9YE13_9BURK|nr:acyl-CoA reductase [Burkholderia stagnalis]RQQ45690.1 long-chain-fatty-acyl-CoA reductase [Burkholderia stagnalis]RQQ59036.1 long-chain-fatty-acyl-CoA reductase [Burkholderia stagnalis]RQQ59501.1 long-chain-fatty-acyl-CoA reductase [Burkholderia stagnalis]RQQ73868.1 long-chain-fatty-acyl-CoA reductase [Burkholderia stagnalis]RQQ78807.1 long-chain-fatty-acyl-CoA reductase [Burkholderia stagnalis]
MLTFFHGHLAPTSDLLSVLEVLRKDLPFALAAPPSADYLIDRLTQFAIGLDNHQDNLPLLPAQREDLQAFCNREALYAKLARELGPSPQDLRRRDFGQPRFEGWQPLGLVVHITPSNAPLLPFFAVMESLLMGNVNWIRPSRRDGDLSTRLLGALLDHDHEDRLAHHVAVLPVAHSELDALIRHADGVAAWGSDATLTELRQQLRPGCRWIDWGHRISFAYVVPTVACRTEWDAIADAVCQFDQQACSSPQCVLVDSDDPEDLRIAGQALADALDRRASQWPALEASVHEAAEVTTQVELARLTQSFDRVPGNIWTGSGWRIIWLHRQELAPSPLFRSVQLRPLPRAELMAQLLTWRTRLQSCTLVASPAEYSMLARTLLAAGVTRIAPADLIHDGYPGEPHDGFIALTRYSRRVSVRPPVGTFETRASLDLASLAPSRLRAHPVMDKAAFHAHPPQPNAQLYFRSGGSTGEPKLAGFTYRDYDRQMRAAGDGLLAAGLDPACDRVINLFYGGNLYGGLLSMFSILERMGVTQFPMGGPSSDDYRPIADVICSHGINTIIGMPNTVLRLFQCESSSLRAYGGIRKILLGGEPVSDMQRSYWRACGVQDVRSALYGSVDAGPLGHACLHSPPGVFHLLTETQWLEILDEEEDRPISGTGIGRLVFTSRARDAQQVRRYDLGDLGRWQAGVCRCGLTSPRFELLGRRSALLRVGTVFFHTERLAEASANPLQIILDRGECGTERIMLLVDGNPEQALSHLRQDPMITGAHQTGLLLLDAQRVAQHEFARHPVSGKVPLVIDRR